MATKNQQDYKDYLSELRQFCHHKEDARLRLCPKSSSCKLVCNADCKLARTTLVDAGQPPLEPGIAPLVFAIRQLGLNSFSSCEGHSSEGTNARFPQVCFHSPSLLLPRLINDCLHQLYEKQQLQNPWYISMRLSEQSLECAFCIEPNLKHIRKPLLDTLQRDARYLGHALPAQLKQLARNIVQRQAVNKTA